MAVLLFLETRQVFPFITKQTEIQTDNGSEFNKELTHYLVWYNTERPHLSHDLMSLVEFILSQGRFSKMWWEGTKS